MITKELSKRLLAHPNFTLREGMLVANENLDLEHPSTIGWLFCLIMRMAPKTKIGPKGMLLKTVMMDGKLRKSFIEFLRDEDGNRLLGQTMASAILMMWDMNWDMVFDDPLSAHSLGAIFLALEHY